MKQQYIDLAERCEAADGGDAELSEAIAVAMGWKRIRPDGLEYHYWYNPAGEREDYPCYTTSLDAAMTLLPEGWGVTYVSHPMPECTWAAVREYEKDKDAKSWTSKALRQSGEVHAKTPALALLAAICRAMGEG
jgi:hypothetical protein